MYKIFSHKTFKCIAVFLAFNLLFQLSFPLASYALTSGPSQPEVQSFEPVGTSEMVDVFTGDFTYNIPLFELEGPNGGYPFNLHYNSGISMDQEASWTGLGWNLNPGAINRQMRGFPDEFKGDLIKREQDMKDNVTFGGAFGGGLEIFGADLKKAGVMASLGIGIYYNNYKGVGYSLDMGIRGHTGAQDGMSAGLGLNLSLDSQEGAGINPSLSLTSYGLYNSNSFTLGMGYNSRRGLTGASMGYSASSIDKMNKNGSVKGGTSGIGKGSASIGGQSTYSFASQAYSPQVSMPMQGRNVSATVKVGGSVFGTYGNAYVSGFFNTQYLKNKNTTSKAYGYMYLENAGTGDLLDFNREKDGMVRVNTPNLASPSMTSDAYSVAGQGIGGMYRAYRSDVGVLYDQQMSSLTFGGAGGFEAGIGMPHMGGDLSINYSETTSKKWEGENETDDVYAFQATQSGNKLYEPYYFKTYGEHTSDSTAELNYIGKSEPVRIKLAQTGSAANLKYVAKQTLEGKSGATTSISNFNNTNEKLNGTTDSKEPRNLVVQPITNDDVIDNAGNEILKEFKVKYFTTTDSINNYRTITKDSIRRNTKKAHHTAGITAVNPDGSRYIYGLPAYNTKQVECQFSVKPANTCSATVEIDKPSLDADKPNYKTSNYSLTDKYYNRTTVPEYAHSYLLTAILGADYIDADNIPGPSVGDLGYWVKFNYVKSTTAYKWRVPFNGANYLKGYNNNTPVGDDKGAYTYGEKEVWYLATVETKSHVAAFNISKRQDGAGVMRELQNAADATKHGASSYKLDKISLYSRSEYEKVSGTPVPIRNVHFEYNYDLCGNVLNNRGQTVTVNGVNINANKGKLTLKKVWFTDENNTRGSISPYEFNYNERVGGVGSAINLAENPHYNTHKYDRWGNYKPYEQVSDSMCRNMDFPYVEQFSFSDGSFKNNLDKNMAVWNMKSITLPSGGNIEIKYESDDYAYVQNKTAMQMFKIESLTSGSSSGTISHPADASGTYRRIYFKLEKLIPNSLSATDRKKEVEKYIDPSRKLYFKVYINLLESWQNNVQDYVSGYADIADFDVDLNSVDGSSNYTKGYVELAKMKIGGKTMKYHPFSIAAWQHLRTNQPDLANFAGFSGDPNSKEAQKVQKIQSLANILQDVTKIFKGYYPYCYGKDYGKVITLNKSFIRLNSPDKIKYGGGVRVKEIVLKDNWNNSTSEDPSIYGQVYDYTMQEEKDGPTISSGVATYEPMIGGDEIALRRAKGFSEEIPLMTPNNLYFEYPINENYYPAPTVGYRKVIVKSLATHYEQLSGGSDPYSIPSGIMTTGATVHEFYTAKDFPVIANETRINTQPFNLFIPIPLIGQITVNHITASQGYSIELNDMHGKLKMVSNYEQDKDGLLLSDPISWVKYNYQSDTVFNKSGKRTEDYLVLNNAVQTLVTDKNGVAQKVQRIVGQDYEFFTDMRESKAFSSSGGAHLNTDVILMPFPLPAFMPWPNMGTSTTMVRTAVTNKIIHRSGILVSTEAYDGGSQVKTENKLFDALTGQPVLITVSNDFDDPIYNYNMPAHLVYDGIGPAYKNIGLKFTATLASGASANTYTTSSTGLPWEHLVAGDEFVVSDRKGTFLEKNGSNLVFYIEGTSYTGSKDFLLVRSGRRNHLSTNAENITALSDPTSNRTSSNCSVTIKIPKCTTDYNGTYYLDACINTEINNINIYLKSASFPNYVNRLVTPYQAGCMPYLQATNLKYISNPSLGIIRYTDTLNGPISLSCNYEFFDDNGSRINFANVDSLKNPVYSSTYSGSISPPSAFSNIALYVKYKNNGGVTKAYIFQSCNPWPIRLDTQPKDMLYTEDTTISTTTYKINNVLNASANRLSDNWPLDNSSLRGSYWTTTNRDNFSAKNSYVKGSEGIWRASESYTYVDNRKQSSNINIKTDGSFDNFSIFNFTTPFMSDCNAKWRKINTITDYNPYTFEIENKDILGIYSSALYGYSGNRATAVASNARNSEIAFEGFEEFTPGQAVNLTNYGTGNLLVLTEAAGATINTYNNYNIISANKNVLIIDKPYNSDIKLLTVEINGATFFPSSSAGTKIKGLYNISLIQPDPSNSKNTLIKLDPTQFTYGDVKWTGLGKFKLSTSTNTPVVTFTGTSRSVSSAFAHTGKNSFLVLGTAEYEQRKLNLVPGKKYVYSSWISKGINNIPTFGDFDDLYGASSRIRFKNINGDILSTTYTIYPSGSIIGLWQKVEVEFTVPQDAVSMLVQLNGGADENGFVPTYFDDIRIYPTVSNMQTYVYSNTDYKLRAMLDNNNYATLYYYDAKGNLFLVKKETEKGIKTIQESFSHQKEK